MSSRRASPSWSWSGPCAAGSRRFPLLAFAGLILASGRTGSLDTRFEQTAVVAAALPVLFAAYLALVPEFGARYGLLFGFLFLVVSGLAAIAIWRGLHELHIFGAGSTLFVYAVWLIRSYDAAWPGILAFVTLFILRHFRNFYLIQKTILQNLFHCSFA